MAPEASQHRLEDPPLDVHCKRGFVGSINCSGMEFLSRASLVKDHLTRALRAIGASEKTIARLDGVLGEADNLDGFRFESNGEDPFNTAKILVTIATYRGDLSGCLGDPCRYVEDRLPPMRNQTVVEKSGWRTDF